MDTDELFSVKNAFWLGKFQTAMKENQNFNANNDRLQIDNKVFYFRSHLALGNYEALMNEITDQSATDLQVLKLLGTLLAFPEKKTEILVAVNDLLSDPTFSDNNTLKLVGAQIYLICDDVPDALKTLATGHNPSLEVQAMKVRVLLQINRVDLAKEELKLMQGKDEDSSLTQLSAAWINLYLGGESYQEAAYIFQELLDKASAISDDDFETSSTLMAGLSAAQMKMGNFDAAMKSIQRGLKRNGVKVSSGTIEWGTINARKPGHLDLLANFVTCSQHLRKTSLVDKFLGKIDNLLAQDKTVKHPFRDCLEVLKSCS